ncbi:MAG: DNA polymerase III subunit gamma/tau [Candidatus Mycalebacterium zealandia]|nr:MAG: DNA polymerase III subunit gamma/tau [Candidatus Mycalebacterium zealandia]
MSSYVVLARKLRPRNFDEIVGQNYIVKALCNAARSGKLAHALLFTGPRGVGKTSTARIVAKAVNCDKPSTEERPCSQDPCESCSLISEGRAVEVQEMDAASHTSVNDVREIIEQSRYVPASGKTRIYIIDETHMLSQAAFNALLKTLEEPPAHVLFILATTEPHKIPATILSRCQRYDFKKVAVSEIASTLESAARSENINIASETVSSIALEADGSLRDGLSLLDRIIATFGTDIDHAEALALLGFVDTSLMNEMFGAIMKRDPAKGFETLGNALDKGIGPAKFAQELASLLRAAVVLKVSGAKSVPEMEEQRAQMLISSAQDRSVQDLETLFDIALDECDRVSRSFYPELAVEAMAMKLCSVEKAVPLDDIMRRLEKLTDGKPPSGQTSEAKPRASYNQHRESEAKKVEAREEQPEAEPQVRINGSADTDAFDEEKKSAKTFAKFLKTGDNTGFMANLVSGCEIKVENSLAIINVPKHSILEQKLTGENSERENLLQAARDFFKRESKIAFVQPAPAQKTNGIEKIQEQPLVKQALDMFDGKIKNLDERRAK